MRESHFVWKVHLEMIIKSSYHVGEISRTDHGFIAIVYVVVCKQIGNRVITWYFEKSRYCKDSLNSLKFEASESFLSSFLTKRLQILKSL